MNTRRFISAAMIGLLAFGCSNRRPVYDEAGNAISEREIATRHTNKSFVFYTAAGGALSFGVSFFAGTMMARAADKSQSSPELWATTGVGTLIGTVLFAQHGKRRDRNRAIEAVKEERKEEATQQLTVEQSKQQTVEQEIKDMKTLRAKQLAEKKKLEEELKKKKGKN